MRALAPFLLAVFSSCSTSAPEDPAIAWEGQRIELTHASKFQAWQQADERWILVFGDAVTDTIGRYHLVPPGWRGVADPTYSLVTVPVQKAVALSTTHLSFIASIGGLHQVAGGAYLDQVIDARVRDRIDGGFIQEASDGSAPSPERLVALGADVMFSYPFGAQMQELAPEFGAIPVAVTEYLEGDPLGRAEWIRFFGMFFGHEEQAEVLFNEISSKYQAIQQEVSAVDERPGVFFGSTWQGKWHAPGGNSYMAQLIRDAGGNYLFNDHAAQGNLTLELEEVVSKAEQARFWGMVLYAPGDVERSDILGPDPRMVALADRTGMQLFFANTRQSDIFGRALVEPHLVLADLTHIIHPDIDRNWTSQYFQAMKKGT